MYPQQPQQGYPPQAYAPPQYPAQPAYQQPPAYPQGYAQPGYAPAPMPYAPPAPPQVPLPTGTLDQFYSQPSTGSGPSFKFMDASRNPMIGKTCAGIVERPLTNADVRAQEQNGVVRTYRDGRPKFVMVVPMLVQPSQEFPEGRAGWWVKGQARDELARAMAEAGAPEGPPEAGAAISVTLVGVKPVPNMNPAYQYRITYMRPQGAGAAVTGGAPAAGGYAYGAAPMADPAQPVQAVPAQQPQMVMTAQGPTLGAPPAPAYVPPAPVPQQPQMPQAAPVQQPVPTAPPAAMTPEQQALFAKLTGQQPPA